MTVVTIKPVNWKTSIPKSRIKKAVKEAIIAFGKPKSIAIRVETKAKKSPK